MGGSGNEAVFGKGRVVEISSNEEGFRGAWYAGTVIGATKSKKKVLVEYKTLMADEGGSKPLRESLDVVQLRPEPPREEEGGSFDFSQEVDAYHNDGWWEGVITGLLPNHTYSVFFRGTREQIDFSHSHLRLHREWVNGHWLPPFQQQVSISKEVKASEDIVEGKFNKGTSVEVSSDEDGFQGAWFSASVIEQLNNGKFLIEYQSLRNDADTEFLHEEVDPVHIRPHPPYISAVDHFNLLEEVDALYNDGWWVGVISKVLDSQKYSVYFRATSEEIEFKYSDLRLHQDWIDGKWVMASQAIML